MAPSDLQAFLITAFVTASLFITGFGDTFSQCSSVQQISLSPCTNFIVGYDFIPSFSCCSQLSSALSIEPQCLCFLLNTTALSTGQYFNQTRLLNLTQECNVQNFPINECNFINQPNQSPYFWTPPPPFWTWAPPPPPPPPFFTPGGGFAPPGFSLSSGGSSNKGHLLMILLALMISSAA
ncbi:hypothetical protein J5N97_009928 [Dioscorea zingiberensis]|uniref:Bifunctional inhibitor/plant lipid transfer protein/seed storage helical domain-containing protein n=1 Tax=Dioscorea zingiberensis TaxID=325984 RepID=A0A9D5CYH2_9LILI|nr:hypothetical protein J5N97_009928 [Dioscorea zingiberensis]